MRDRFATPSYPNEKTNIASKKKHHQPCSLCAIESQNPASCWLPWLAMLGWCPYFLCRNMDLSKSILKLMVEKVTAPLRQHLYFGVMYARPPASTNSHMEIIATCGTLPIIRIWNISSGEAIKEISMFSGMTYCACFSPCGSLLAACPNNCQIIVWETNSWTKKAILGGLRCNSVIFNKSSDKIVSASRDGSVWVWDLATSRVVLKFRTSGINSDLFSFSLNFNEDEIAMPCNELVHVYDAHTGELKRSLQGHHRIVSCVQFSHDGALLVSASLDARGVIWDVSSSTLIRVLRGHADTICCIRFSTDACRVITGSHDKTARIWDVATGECLLILNGHRSIIYSCCFSEDGSKAITSSADTKVTIWDSYSGEELMSLMGDTSGAVVSLSYCLIEAGSYI